MRKPVKLFIVEGENRDYRFLNEMLRCFMVGKYKTAVVAIPAAQNLYMLYEKLAEDDFETDVVEVLRESVPEACDRLKGICRREIDEVYLFFDLDAHQNNLPSGGVDAYDVIEQMLHFFDNETEHGRLYINYPMVEALYDFRRGQCEAFSKCYVPVDFGEEYKRLVSEGNMVSASHMGFEQWKDAIEVFAVRVKCLLGLEELSFDLYRKTVTTISIFESERTLCENTASVFVLCAFPEFLLDYFRVDFWNSRVRMSHFIFGNCPKHGR